MMYGFTKLVVSYCDIFSSRRFDERPDYLMIRARVHSWLNFISTAKINFVFVRFAPTC